MRQSVFHRIHRIEIGEVHLSHGVGLFVMIQQMMLVSRSVKHQFSFFFRKIFERNICTDAQFISGNVLHKGPHERLPRQHGTLVDGQILIRYQSRFIHGPDHTRPVAVFAGTCAVEGQFFRSRGVEMFSAYRAYQISFGRHIHGGLHVMPVRTSVAGKS